MGNAWNESSDSGSSEAVADGIMAVLVGGKLVGSVVDYGSTDAGSVVVTSGAVGAHADSANKRIESVHAWTCLPTC